MVELLNNNNKSKELTSKEIKQRISVNMYYPIPISE
jgi:hypothetical protein